MTVFGPLIEFNKRVENTLAPERPNTIDTYREILSGISYSRALHFGSGRDRHDIATELRSRGEVIAIDLDREGLRENETPRKVRCDGHQLPFAENSFQLVCSEFVFEHLSNPHLALREIHRVLVPGGSFVVLVPNPSHYYARIADFTPYWFHTLWLRLSGNKNPERDTFPTQYGWGTYTDLTEDPMWSIAEFYSFPGPTGYTRLLPIHLVFTLFARIMVNRPCHHVRYLAHLRSR